ncbi:MAG: GAF domain-containing protein [Sideroxydans sp.]|nr:GAF domain-containing protein [Sideroxydans sp.]
MQAADKLRRRLKELNEIGAALSAQHDIRGLLAMILEAAMRVTHADAGTLYLHDDEQHVLRFEILRNDSLHVSMGGLAGEPIGFAPIALYDAAGQGNHAMVVSHAALTGETVNVADAYQAAGYDFSGTQAFDATTGYRSQSFLAVPMRDHQGEIIGVLQLINALCPDTQAIVAFSLDDQQLLESLASQAAIALSNRRLIAQMEVLFESLIQLINTALDDKSPYTGGHCARVPMLTMMLAEAVNRTQTGPLKDFVMTEKDRYELKIAGLLHDCGKITTPVHVVDKSTKLHTLFDRIELLDTRFEVLKRDSEIALLRQLAMPLSERSVSDAACYTAHQARLTQLDAERDFLRVCNVGGETMSLQAQARVAQIAQQQWRNSDGVMTNFLSVDEVENLTIRAGTLTAAEREIINHHIVVTIKMLEALPWPKHLKNVPEYAGGHHERMDGKGYPRGLTREQMSVQARVMGIADIFEALTAKDRPYKKGKTLSESLRILAKFKDNGHIDPDLFEVFIKEKVYLAYARQFMSAEQIDVVNEAAILAGQQA